MATPPQEDKGAAPSQGRRRFDMTVSVPTVLMWVLAGAVGGAVNLGKSYISETARVDKIEVHAAAQDERMTRIEQAQLQQKTDTTQQLRDISSDVSYIRNYLLNNAAGSRSDTRRWSK